MDPAPDDVAAGSRSRFSLHYEAGPDGIAEGGAVYFMPSPFWGWSQPQVAVEDGEGFCRVSTTAHGGVPCGDFPWPVRVCYDNRTFAKGLSG